MLIKLRNLFLLVSFPMAVAGYFLADSGKPVYAAGAPLKVVASNTLFADLMKKIGGDKVEVVYVASPKFNSHFIQPKPSDVRNVTKADLFVFAGLDLEAWVDPLLEAAGKPELFRGGAKNVDMSQGIRLLKPPAGVLSRSMGDQHLFGNPHYVMNPANAKIMAGNLLEKLKSTDPDNADYYEKNEKTFVSQLDVRVLEWEALCAHCAGQEIISYHDDIEYFADFLGVKDEQYLEPKPGIPPTPRHLEFLENYAKEKKVKAIVMPTYFPKDAANGLARRVGAKVVTICQNVGEVEGTGDFFDFFDYDFKQISEALK